jgi:hypothetical protein
MLASIRCVAILGTENNPLYMKNFTSMPDLSFHYMVHIVLDFLDEKGTVLLLWITLMVLAKEKQREPYQGLLYAFEDMGVYGYVTHTNIKFILVIGVVDGVAKDSEVRPLMKQLHHAYLALISNPFYNAEDKTIKSQNFDKAVQLIVSSSR